MPSVSGQLLFNTNNPAPTTGTAITSGVPIALVDTSTNVGLIIKSDASGNYVFNNVPAGSFKIVECFGATTTITSPGDFTVAANVGTVTPSDPPITSMPSPPAQANLVQSLSPNTKFITVAAANITGQNFVDSPVEDIPIVKQDITLVGGNLITGANFGDWGTLPAGTAQGTAPATSPYASSVPGFTYTLPSANTPGDGQYSVLNMSNYSTFGGNWYNTSDHTSRDETGRYFLAGAAGSQVIFTETIPVSSATYYAFSGWIMNPVRVLGTIPSQLTIKVTGTGGQILYQQSLLSIAPQTVLPIWNESATIFNTLGNNSINFQMLSTGAVGGGNDYIIDDLSIQQANVDTIVTSTKSVDKAFASIGDALNYTVVLTNTGSSTAQSIVFSDTIPTGTTFNTGSVKVNNTTFAAFNPTPPGFTLTSPSTMASGSTVTITFSVTVTTIPTINPIPNSSVTNYFFQPIPGGATIPQTILSNEVSTQMNQAELRTTKSRDLAFVDLGSIITYTIPVGNYGTTIANNVIFKDTIPNGTTLVPNSVFVNGTVVPNTTPNPPGINLGTIDIGATTTVVFKVQVTTVPIPNPISNSATSTYSYTVDPSIPTTKSAGINTNIVTSQYNNATLTATKSNNKAYADVNDTITYNIVIKNTGNVTANNIVFIDTIPNGTSLVAGSFKQDLTNLTGTPNPPGTTLPNSLAPNGTTTVTFQVKVDTLPNPNPIPNNAAATYTYTVDPSSPNGGAGSTDTNTVSTQVNNVNLGSSSKTVDKAFATCGDILTYTVLIPNSGNTTAQNVVFKDTIPTGTIFVANSLVVNNVVQTGLSPNSGVTIPNIAPGATTTVTFQVQVQC